MTKQHANATTTPEIRAFIHESDLPTAVLARLLKISESTVRKWRKRDSQTDASHVPKQLNTTLSEAQEYVVVELRTRLLLSLDELLAVCKQFIHEGVSRAGLQRCLKRHGVSRLADMDESVDSLDVDNPDAITIEVAIEDTQDNTRLTSKLSPAAMREFLNRTSKVPTDELSADEVVQVNVTQLPAFSGGASRLLIAHDPNSSWVYVDIYDGSGEKAEAEAAGRYMSYVLNKAPFHIRRILAGNYTEFLSRFRLLNENPEQAKTLSPSDDFDQYDSENATNK
jgi:transposase-like protein